MLHNSRLGYIKTVHAVSQLLDDSTDRTTRDLVDDKVVEWRERGVNIEVMRRTNRAGYKAGALKEVRSLCNGSATC